MIISQKGLEALSMSKVRFHNIRETMGRKVPKDRTEKRREDAPMRYV